MTSTKLLGIFLLIIFISHSIATPFVNNKIGRIAGGTEAARNQFPFQVLLFLTLRTNEDSLCGGSILSSKFVLTAAHCFHNFEIADILGGVHDFEVDNPAYEVEIRPQHVTIHQQYNQSNFLNDIAIVNVAHKTIPLGATLQTINLAPRSLANTDLTNRVGRIAGWGITKDGGAPSSRLLFIDSPIIPNSECTRVFGSIFSNANNICLSGANSRSACPGDSGGPLTIEYGTNNRIQVGLTSFGSLTTCQQGYPVAFTRITSYLNWIQQTTGIELS